MSQAIILMARMGSRRLPGKVLLPVQGRPLLGHLFDRLRRADFGDVILATSALAGDDPIADFADAEGVAVFRGDEEDWSNRILQAALIHDIEAIVRVTADCPLIDPATVDLVGNTLVSSGADYVSPDWPSATLPTGMGCEGVRRSALERLHESATPQTAEQRWMSFLNGDNGYCPASVPTGVQLDEHRVTVDEPADFEVVEQLLNILLPEHPSFTLADVVATLEAHPEIAALNSHVQQLTGPHAKSGA